MTIVRTSGEVVVRTRDITITTPVPIISENTNYTIKDLTTKEKKGLAITITAVFRAVLIEYIY